LSVGQAAEEVHRVPDDKFSNASLQKSVDACPSDKPCYWIEIELRDQDDRPVPNEEFLVVAADGEKFRGYLNDKGWARLAPLESGGDCSVTFPNLDKSLWNYDGSDGPVAGRGAKR
jgi:hypothetical protein